MRVATIDIGTNTVLLLVAEPGSDGCLVAVEEHATITRLGQGVDQTRTLAPEAVERTNACLDRYADVVKRLRVDKTAVVGTSAMRDAGGGDAVRAHVKALFGVEARTISGDEEARLTFRGAVSGLPVDGDGRVVVFDIGGGSTEVVDGERTTGTIHYARSYDVGSVRLTERHVRTDPPTEGERAAVMRAARDAFATIPESVRGAPVVGIAGTVTTLAAVSLAMVDYDGARVHGLVLEVSELERVIAKLGVPLDERKRIAGLDPKRADVIIAGALVALAFLERVGASSLAISDRGVRWGLAEELANASQSPAL